MRSPCSRAATLIPPRTPYKLRRTTLIRVGRPTCRHRMAIVWAGVYPALQRRGAQAGQAATTWSAHAAPTIRKVVDSGSAAGFPARLDTDTPAEARAVADDSAWRPILLSSAVSNRES